MIMVCPSPQDVDPLQILHMRGFIQMATKQSRDSLKQKKLDLSNRFFLKINVCDKCDMFEWANCVLQYMWILKMIE